ncbi:MAG TPA: response regulator [Thermodesulfobacteriota bacterium]|nr:response regulator [Thermodesulfobacteriota bacterium]
MHVLVADDNQTYAGLLQESLGRAGYRVGIVRSAAEAVETVRRVRPGLLLLDLYMPDGDGDVACRQLKADRETSATPIVMMSAGGRKDEAQRCLAAGCDEFLVKPIRHSELLLAVSRHLHGRYKNVRVPVRIPVTLESAGSRWPAASANLSMGGMFIEMSRLFQPGTEMVLEFPLPGPPAPRQLLVRGKVAWVNRPEAKIKRDLPGGVGVEFTKLSAEHLSALGMFVASWAEGTGAGAAPAEPPRPEPARPPALA